MYNLETLASPVRMPYYLNTRYLSLHYINMFFHAIYMLINSNTLCLNEQVLALKFTQFYLTLHSMYSEVIADPSMFLHYKYNYFLSAYFATPPADMSLYILEQIEFDFSHLISKFYTLLNTDAFYFINQDKFLLLELFDNLIRCNHPIFNHFSKYLILQDNLTKFIPKKNFDFSIFLDILLAIHLEPFYSKIFTQGTFKSFKYDINHKFPFIGRYIDRNYMDPYRSFFNILPFFEHDFTNIIAFLDNFDFKILEEFHIGLP